MINPFKKKEEKPSDPYIEQIKEKLKQKEFENEIRFPKEQDCKKTYPPLGDQLRDWEYSVEAKRKARIRKGIRDENCLYPRDD